MGIVGTWENEESSELIRILSLENQSDSYSLECSIERNKSDVISNTRFSEPEKIDVYRFKSGVDSWSLRGSMRFGISSIEIDDKNRLLISNHTGTEVFKRYKE